MHSNFDFIYSKDSLSFSLCTLGLQPYNCSPCATLQKKLVVYLSMQFVRKMSQDVKVFSCFKSSLLQSLMVYCCFYDVFAKQYRQSFSFSSTVFLFTRWTLKVVIHRLLICCACVKHNILPKFSFLLPSLDCSVVFYGSCCTIVCCVFSYQ